MQGPSRSSGYIVLFVRAHVHGDFCAKFVEYARKIQRNATFLLHRPFTVKTDGAQVMQEKSHLLQEMVKLVDERTIFQFRIRSNFIASQLYAHANLTNLRTYVHYSNRIVSNPVYLRPKASK